MAEKEIKEELKPELENKIEKRPRIKQEPDTPGKIMVTGIPKVEDYSEADLEKEFAPFGRITEINIIRDRSRRDNLPRGFAFITYENPQDAEDAIKALEGKNLGGETPIHCEQAVVGLRRSLKLLEVRGGARGRGGRGGPRGRSRGFERGGRSRGMPGRGGRPFRDERFYDEMRADEYYEDYYESEVAYDDYPGREMPPKGNMFRGRGPLRGGPPGRGGIPGRGAERPPRGGGLSRPTLLPSPSARRGYRGGEEYFEDDANGYQEEYYEGGQPYVEEYVEHYAEAEDYYTRAEYPRGRGNVAPRGRGRPHPMDEYGYSYEEHGVSSRPPAARRNVAPGFSEDPYEEVNPRMAAEQFERPRGRGQAGLAPRPGRGGAVPGRRGGPVHNDPFAAAEDHGMYESGGGYEVEPLVEPSVRRPGGPVPARPTPPNRVRPAPAADMYSTERMKPSMSEAVGQRRAAMVHGRFTEDYETANPGLGQEREIYQEVRRPIRRPEPDVRDPYQRAATETDAYVSYPTSSRGHADLSRKRHLELYEEEGRREFEAYRPVNAGVPHKRDRLDRAEYEAYTSRQEVYRGY